MITSTAPAATSATTACCSFWREEPAQHVDPHRVAGEPLAERLAVLVREQRRRREDRDLLAVLHRLERRRASRPRSCRSRRRRRSSRSIGTGRSMSAFTSTIACELVRRLLVRERVLDLALPRRVGREREAGRREALAVEDHELGRDLLHRAAHPAARLLPLGAAHLAERRRVAAGVAPDRADLVRRHVELVAAAVREQQVVALDAADRPRDHALVAADAVHLVHDEVAGLQVLVVVDGLARLARAAVHAAAAGEVGLGDEREPGAGHDDAALERRDDDRDACPARGSAPR